MPHQQILRINAIQLKTQEDAFRILGITDHSEKAIDKAYKKLALITHPDKNPDDQIAAAAAFKKLSDAKEFAITGKHPSVFASTPKPNSTTTNYPKANPSNDDSKTFANAFNESSYMKGPLIRQARDILLSLAGIYNRDFKLESAAKIQQFFAELKINQVDKTTLLNYVYILFPHTYVSSDTIAGQFSSKDLQNYLLFLSDLMDRYPTLKNNYQNILIEKVEELIKNTMDAFYNILKQKNLENIYSNGPQINFNSFVEFAHAFAGNPHPANIGLTAKDIALKTALDLLNNFLQKNKQLFSNLFKAANLIRKMSDGPFVYSNTSLEANLEKAKKIDKLCQGKTQLDVFNSQLLFLMRLILGNHAELPELTKSFPAVNNIYEFVDFLKEDNNVFCVYLNHFTQEKIKRPTERYDTFIKDEKNIILPAIPPLPELTSSLLDFYLNHYGNVIAFLKEVNGEIDEFYTKLGLDEAGVMPLLNALKRTALKKDSLQEESSIVIYKAGNGELAVKFPNLAWRDAFIKELGGIQHFPKNHPHFSKQSCPESYEESPTTLYFPAYKAGNGELAAVFPNLAMREAFRRLLRHAPANTMSIYPNKDAIYFNNSNLFLAGYHFIVTAPVEISSNRNSAIMDVCYASRMVGQGLRFEASFFKKLPEEISLKIAALATDNNYLPESDSAEIVKNHLKKPGK